MAEKLRGVTDTFATNVQRWPEYSRTRFDALLPVNTLTPRDVSATGGCWACDGGRTFLSSR